MGLLRSDTGRPRMVVASGSAGLALAGAIMLTACTAAPIPDVTTSASYSAAPAPAPASTPVETPLVFAPDKSAADNLAYFTSLATQVVENDSDAGGRALIDALVVGGFDKAAMQVTPDTTSIDLAADSVQFSVRFNGECLVGQFGPASDGVQTMVAPLLGTGTCLVGATRQIDW